LIQWCRIYATEVPELDLIYAIPNQGGAGYGAMRRGKKLKEEGARSGLPDLHLPISRGCYLSLYVEMKDVKGGRLSPNQLDWFEKLEKAGNAVVLAKGFEEGKEAIMKYLEFPRIWSPENPGDFALCMN
jgi:hypothetical protein